MSAFFPSIHKMDFLNAAAPANDQMLILSSHVGSYNTRFAASCD
jgi:hypothetical protein